MARWIEWTNEQRQAWDDWLSTRPPHVRELAARFPGDRLYLLRGSGHRVIVTQIDEGQDGSCTFTVAVTAQFNAVLFERRVFGINPEDLEECDLPDPQAPVGALLDEQETADYINSIRTLNGRPPLGAE